MELHGACKEAFEKWYDLSDLKIHWSVWRHLPDSMKYGVLVDFFDSVDIEIYITLRCEVTIYGEPFGGLLFSDFNTEARPEARTAAIKKACELFNEHTSKLKQRIRRALNR